MPQIIVPSQFIDVDFQKDPRYVFGDLGAARVRGAPIFEDTFDDVLEESKWEAAVKEIDDRPEGHLENLIVNIFDQGNEGSCVSNATCQAHQILQALQYGKEKVVKLSAIHLYKRCGNSAGGGSMLSDNLDEIETRGVIPLDIPENARFPHRMGPTGFSKSMPSGWETTGKLFLGLERFDIRTLAGMITASYKGYPIVVGRQGHSICYVRPTWKNGINFIYPNSWSLDWGFALGGFSGGFGMDSLSQVKMSASWAFAIRSVTAAIAA